MAQNPRKLKFPSGVTISKLMRSTPSDTTLRSQSVRVLSTNRLMSKNGFPTLSCICKSTEPTTAHRPPKHKVLIRLMNRKDKLWVSCSCESFMYNWEYALMKNGGSSIKYSNGDPATRTNPRNIPGVCPHIYKLLRRASTLRQLQAMLQ